MKQSRTLSLIMAALVGLASGIPSTALADDTVIYTGVDSSAGGIRPNVLFILDTSGSMSATVSGTGLDRLDNMKNAMQQILDETSNINVGLMRFTDPGGPILFPVSGIDEDADVIANAGQPDIAIRVSDSADDAEELVTSTGASPAIGTVDTTSVQLELVETTNFGADFSLTNQISQSTDDAESSPSFFNTSSTQIELTDNASGNRTNGLRFQNLAIPAGASIIHAELDFRSRSNRSGATNLTIRGEAADGTPAGEPLAFGSGAEPRPDDRDDAGELTAASVAWSVPEWFSAERYQSPELSAVVQEIVCRGAGVTADCPIAILGSWATGNNMSFIITGTPGSLRDSSSFDDDSSFGAILRVDYATGGGGTEEQMVGVRFQNVGIPQGATITNATIEFTPRATEATPLQLTIKVENVDDAAAFTTAGSNISGRTPTTGKNWTPATWTVDDPQDTPDLKDIVQLVVDRAGWCGGNDMAFTITEKAATGIGAMPAYSFDGDPAKAPKLKVDYDISSLAAGQGCTLETISRQIAQSADDAEQIGSSLYLTSATMEMTTTGTTVRTNGMRFQDIPLAPGSTIESAVMVFASKANESNAATWTFKGENPPASGVQTFSTSKKVLDRTTLGATMTWAGVPAWVTNGTYTTPDMSAVIQAIINDGDWDFDDDLAIIVSGSGLRQIRTYNDNAGSGPRLVITAKRILGNETGSGTSTVTTVRDRLKELVDALDHSGYTPIVDTLYEAARYFRGEGLQWGNDRGTGSSTVQQNTRVSHPASYTGGTIGRDAGCTDANLSASACKTEHVNATPIYKTPITEACQANYIVLLTDGAANHNNSTSLVKSMAGIGSCQGTMSNGDGVAGGESCGIDLVKYLVNNDQSTDFAGEQTVTTYTIGFNFTTQFLRDLALEGGGTFNEANTAAELVEVFQAIVADILSRTTSFAAPALSVNAFNKLFHRAEVYFAFFKPNSKVAWDGNVKKYFLCESDADGCTLGEVLDKNDVPAVGSDSLIKDSASSDWSSSDGSTIDAGGAGGRIIAQAYTVREDQIYTYTGTFPVSAGGVNLSSATHRIEEANGNVDLSFLGLTPASPADAAADTAARKAHIEWIQGRDVDDADADGNTTETRYAFADPLHSSPLAVTFGGTELLPVTKVFVASNDGSIRMTDASTGNEEWAIFVPEKVELQTRLRDNPNGNHEYGVDGVLSSWQHDDDGDGVIDAADGDFVRIIVGMRRGGQSYYVFDVTPSSPLNTVGAAGPDPTLLYRLNPNDDPDFARLGETWSAATFGMLRVGLSGSGNAGKSEFTPVLIFGGGYDQRQDDQFGYDPPDPVPTGSLDSGNAIYVVNAETGARLVYVTRDLTGDTGPGVKLTDSEMVFPFASDVSTFDSDGDGGLDRIYAVDVGGQVWRVDMSPDLSETGSLNVSAERLANLSFNNRFNPTAPPAAADERRLFYRPAVVRVRDDVTFSSVSDYDIVVVATGERPNPLETAVQNRIYAFRDTFITPNDDLGGNFYPDGSGSADPWTVSDLFNLSSINDPQGADLSSLNGAKGWYIDLPDAGEKALSAAEVIAGKLFITTYLPAGVVSGSSCSLAEGNGRLWGLNVLNAAALFNWDGVGDSDNLTKSDRYYTLGPGIPSSAVPIFQPEGVTLLIGGGGIESVDPDVDIPRFETYWYQQ